MATQAGMGLSKALILVGAGFTGSIVLRNHKLSDILGELQALLTGITEKSSESSNADSESSLLASQLDRLTREVQRMTSSRPITILSGNSSQTGNITSLVVPVASLGILGYGYMWWKGLSFSDLMYVTKSNMANAVSGMTKHLERVSAALAATKRHLTQRLENLDGKLDEQKEMSTEIKREVTDACDKLSDIGNELNSLQELVWGLNGKISAIEDKQNFACTGVLYLCRLAGVKVGKMPEFLQDSPKPTGKCGYLGSADMGLKEFQQIADAIESGNIDKLETDVTMHDDISSLGRTASFK